MIRWLVGLAVFLPILAVTPGHFEGRTLFVSYREPKLVALSILGWLLLAVLAHAHRDLELPEVERVLRRPPVLALGAFLAYMLTSGLWVRVRPNHFYEANQYLLLFLLLVGLSVHQARDPSTRDVVRLSLIAGGVLLTLVGILQWSGGAPWLPPINPELGSTHPSLMGYKNPAALAILGQVFLLGEAATRSGLPRRLRAFLVSLLALEIVYLLSLRSRTSYVAFFAAGLLLAVLRAIRSERTRSPRRILAATAAVLALASSMVVFHPPTRERMASTLGYLTSPSSLLESDRGIYFRNTLNMARHRPFGVGLGDWQTAYPLYRIVDRHHAFDDHHEVRRAHGDHVQFLGEGGWPGLGLWLGFLVSTLVVALRRRSRRSDFYAIQWFAFVLAMAGDYVIELPWAKLQFFCVLFLVVSDTPPTETPPPRGRTRLGTLLAVCLAILAALQTWYHVQLFRRDHTASLVEALYQAPPRKSTPTEILELHAPLAETPGHTKRLYRAWLMVGETARRMGERDLALRATTRGLRLHPYSPSALEAMASVTRGTTDSAAWLRAYHYVREEAVSGFAIPYPTEPRTIRNMLESENGSSPP